MIKKFTAQYALVSRFVDLKYAVSRSFGLTEGHLECEKHAVMLGCLCITLEREDGATFLQNGET